MYGKLRPIPLPQRSEQHERADHGDQSQQSAHLDNEVPHIEGIRRNHLQDRSPLPRPHTVNAVLVSQVATGRPRHGAGPRRNSRSQKPQVRFGHETALLNLFTSFPLGKGSLHLLAARH
jgi:hypothetical protein